ncbi:K+ transporter [Halorubrum alkaliphilum]|uniref:K+ transporter n=1 Tax=Halorubrum alkaliphilum TaxID=261290 RepID=A0A8T4GFL4_9EURY|nr:hypothetical protein [Halorubrum alkaliphilum]MBP1923298.1 K+ transporter [Halorubrum alkaliphilum]
MAFPSSVFERLRYASCPVVTLVVGVALVVVYRRASRIDPAFGLVVVGFLVLNGGLVALAAWAANRD